MFCPKSGKIVAIERFAAQDASGLSEPHPLDDLVNHLTRTTDLGRGEAARVIAEVIAYFSEPLDVVVKRRHAEMQAAGLTNVVIFERIRQELRFWRVAAPALSDRQVRRIIYG